MRALLVVLVTLAASYRPALARADDEAVDGRIVTDEVTIEIVHPHHGRVIETPEGFLRVEDGPDLDQSDQVGSFGTYHAGPTSGESVPDRVAQRTPTEGLEHTALRPDGLVDRSAPVPGHDPCRPQRSLYLRRLLEMSGVKVDRPVDSARRARRALRRWKRARHRVRLAWNRSAEAARLGPGAA